MSAPTFTAAQLAAALGLPKRFVKRELAKLETSGTKTIPARSLPAWAVESLPYEWQAKIAQRIEDAGSQNLEHMLAEGLTLPAPGLVVQKFAPGETDSLALWNGIMKALATVAGQPGVKLPGLDTPPAMDGGSLAFSAEIVTTTDTRRAPDDHQVTIAITLKMRIAPCLRNQGKDGDE